MSKHILVIEDEEGVRDSFQIALEGDEYTVETADCGENGIKKAKDRQPDLIFLDMKMPGIDGVETLQRLREFCKEAPIYIVTAFYKEYMQALQNVLEKGINFEICHKPIDAHQIKRIVDNIINKDILVETKLFLKLYIAGHSASSTRALDGVKRIFDEQLEYDYDLSIIDVLSDPQLAEADNIIATPTLVLVRSSQNRMIIGDLSNTAKVLVGLNLPSLNNE